MSQIIEFTHNGSTGKETQGEKPLVSVIIPTYNRLHVLPRAIESVRAQTYRNYEIIVIDDGSRDGTTEWIAQNARDVKFIRLDHNSGMCKARNAGIKVSKGAFIALLDSDDEWTPKFLENHVEALSQNRDACLAFSQYAQKNPGKKTKIVGYTPAPGYPSLTHRMLLEISFIKNFIMFPAKVLKDTGLYNERYRNVEDRELYLRLLALDKPIVYIPRTLGIRHVSPDSISWNMANWSRHAMLLLDDFYANPKNFKYKTIEKEARRRVALKLIKGFNHERLNQLTKLKLFATIMKFIPRYSRYLSFEDFHAILGRNQDGKMSLSLSTLCVYLMILNLKVTNALKKS